MTIVAVAEQDGCIAVDISGTVSRFHYFWLRDNCPQCQSPNGQKLHETNTLDPHVRPVTVQHDGYLLSIDWSDGAHSEYPVAFLLACRYDNVQAAPGQAAHWDARIADEIGYHEYAAVCDDPAQRRAWLSDVAVRGFALLRNVPTSAETIFDVVHLFGFVRETNYGRLFEVRAEDKPSNLAFTPQPLSVHTDNPYRDPCPTLQLLHCLVQADEGGLTALTDGFAAAERLRTESPSAFDLLSGWDVDFHYRSADAVLDNRDRIIRLDGAGRVRAIRINNRSMAPLQLPFDVVPAFYEALATFRAILEDDSMQFRLRLEPGDLLLFDNERVLHGRAGESVGERHLQGCYADRDGLLSTLAVLERDHA